MEHQTAIGRLKFDIRRSDHLAPFFVFCREEFSELGGRTCKDGFTPIGNGLLDFGIGEARIDRIVEHVDDRRGRILSGYEASAWYGIGAPKGTPVEIIDMLNKEINAALAEPKMKSRLADLGGRFFPARPPSSAS
jgi:hypothetical protein